jgi:von Willebrand factor type A domain
MRLTKRTQTWIARAMILGMLLALAGASFLVEEPQRASAQAEPGTEVNVELIMDSSGSMAAETDTGEPRIDAAKRVLNQVIDAIPVDRPELNVGFRVFGHLGDNTEAGREESCQSSELTVPVDGVDKDALREQVANYAPVGWTPIGLSLERAAADFPAASETVTNAIILVTDGLETCDADPCAIATALKESEAGVTVYVVGLGLNEEELRITSCIAENTGGRIVGAQNADELSVALFTFLEELEVVVTTGFLEIESIGGLYPLATLTCAEQQATDLNPQGGEPFTYTFTPDTNRVEAPVGVCDLAWTNPSGNETTIRVNIEADRTTFVRGSLLKFPQGAGEIYVLKAQDGTVIWQDQIEQGDWVWVLPGIYTCDLAELVGDPILMSFTVQTLPGSATQVEIFTAP